MFTSESVCAGHPDKICDQVSDAILDAIIAQDPHARVAVETVVGKNLILLLGEVTTTATVDFEAIARAEIARLGYTNPEWGFSHTSPLQVAIHAQSPEIARGVSRTIQGAGDQGMMFGYACTETPELMPLPITIAHALTRAIDVARETEVLAYLRPDGKSQVTVAYLDGKPVGIEQVVLAVPHNPEVTLEQVQADLLREVVTPVLAAYGFSTEGVKLTVNGTGVWHNGGPASDAGLTGRKIVVDGYGGYARVGGGAFSGKDPSKVDRSGAYAARFLAKNIVAAGLATRAEVALAYCIGKAHPVMKSVETFGTAVASDGEIAAFVEGLFDCSVEGIITGLDLRKPVYHQTAAYGHFGREGVSWEQVVGK
ncbi:methionine adenosyltransferase [soil metagenome]